MIFRPCRNTALHTHVDDTKFLLSFRLHDQKTAISRINQDLTKIRNWCFDNQLLNPGKTKSLVCGSRQMAAKVRDFQLSLLGNPVVPVKCAGDLGVILETSLTFDNHITSLVSSCTSRLRLINQAKYCFDKHTLTIIINALVFSKLYYCSSVWSNTSDSNISKLQAVQNFACRIVSGARKYDHVTPILKELRCLPVKKRLFYLNCIMAFKCMNGLAPSYLTNQFIKRCDVSRRTTRYSGHLNIPLFRTATGQRSFHYRTVTIWNSRPSELKSCKSVSKFNKFLRDWRFIP